MVLSIFNKLTNIQLFLTDFRQPIAAISISLKIKLAGSAPLQSAATLRIQNVDCAN